jgi:hypothetical protein
VAARLLHSTSNVVPPVEPCKVPEKQKWAYRRKGQGSEGDNMGVPKRQKRPYVRKVKPVD